MNKLIVNDEVQNLSEESRNTSLVCSRCRHIESNLSDDNDASMLTPRSCNMSNP